MSSEAIERGAQTVIRKWIKAKPWDRVLIVSSVAHADEARALKQSAMRIARSADLLMVERDGIDVGVFFDQHETIFDDYTAIIAATDYSLVTTKATKRAISGHKKFLSLPLSTNNGQSMLGFDFMQMDTRKSRLMAQLLMDFFRDGTQLRADTQAGTDLTVRKKGRHPGYFNGEARVDSGFGSASFEVYIPIEETKTEGKLVVDGSFGYIGRPEQPTTVKFSEGRVVSIDGGIAGERLQAYMNAYDDPNIFVAGEFGIGLNSISKCEGNCYIEDESTYGTFHIGMGRNVGLGGVHEAKGHFDLVMLKPDLYVDNRQLMQQGKIIVAAPQFTSGVY